MASTSFGGTVKLTGESDYKKALKEITTNLKLLGSEMKVATSSFDKNSASISDLSNVNEILNKKLAEQQKKVEETKQRLTAIKAEYGENSQQTKKWQTALNEAQAEVNKTSREIDNNKASIQAMEKANVSNTSQLKEFSKEEDNAGNSTLKLGDLIKANIISEGIIAGFKGLVGAIKEVGSEMLDMGKQALDSFSEYEQLVGGVETLFGDSAGVVEDYANKAYQSAGLSANEYMETVTSFSASLLQSVGNDTAKAAEYSNQAIIDMSDNANKMGTSMESIQNAYQGFAKQNYTMLDNLKLGYGGTKSEMERLIADANKVKEANGEMANLSIESFADVTEAIHIIQTEMGITGTTAKEASTTIQGSVGSMKSAWQNLLTGLASGSGNVGTLVQNMVDSFTTALDNILPVVQQIVDSVIEILPELINQIVEHIPEFLEAGQNILSSLIEGITNNMDLIINGITQLISSITTTIVQMLPQILQMGIQLIISLVQGIAQQAPTLIPQIVQALIDMVTALLDNIDLIIDAGIQLIMGLADGLINALPILIEKIPEIIEKLVMGITDNLPKIIEAGITLTIKLAEGLIKAIPQLVAKIPQIITSLIKGLVNLHSKIKDAGKDLLEKIKDGISDNVSKMLDVGKNIVEGLWNGIKNATSWIKQKVGEFAKSILDGMKSALGIKSPSTVFRDQVGVNLAKGIGVGFENAMKDVNRDMVNAIPRDFDLDTNINVGRNISTDSNNQNGIGGNKYETNNFNFYSAEDSPAEYARQIRKEMQYMKLLNG